MTLQDQTALRSHRLADAAELRPLGPADATMDAAHGQHEGERPHPERRQDHCPRRPVEGDVHEDQRGDRAAPEPSRGRAHPWTCEDPQGLGIEEIDLPEPHLETTQDPHLREGLEDETPQEGEEQGVQDERPDEAVLPGRLGQQVGRARTDVRNHEEADGHGGEGREDSGEATEAPELTGEGVVLAGGAAQTRPKRCQVAPGGAGEPRARAHQEADQELHDRRGRVGAAILLPAADVVVHARNGDLEDRVAHDQGDEDPDEKPHRAEAKAGEVTRDRLRKGFRAGRSLAHGRTIPGRPAPLPSQR